MENIAPDIKSNSVVENTEASTPADTDYTKTVISNRPAAEMSEPEKKAERKLIRDRLKDLNA